jgi:hypothetical protein
MPLSVAQRYQAHVQNLRKLDVACSHIYRELKDCLAKRQASSSEALLKTFILLIGAWSEVRFLKILHEPNAFSDEERLRVLGGAAKIDQWKLAVEIGFRRRYGIPAASLSSNLARTARHRFEDLMSLIGNDLAPIIQIRNRLAHGQWCRTFNNELTEISQPTMAILNTENALSANFKMKIIDVISTITNDLLVGGAAFERDFDNHYRILEQTKFNLRNRNFEQWADMLRQKHERGRAARREFAR